MVNIKHVDHKIYWVIVSVGGGYEKRMIMMETLPILL